MNRLFAALESDSLLRELWDYLEDKYVAPDMGHYENLGFGSGSLVTVRTIVFGFVIGFIVAAFAVVIDKKHLGDFVRTLIANNCNSPENAKTLDELGYYGYSIRNAVRRNTALRRVVKCREEEEYYSELGKKRTEYEEKRKANPNLPYFNETKYRIDLEKDRFYIPRNCALPPNLSSIKRALHGKDSSLLL